MSYYCNSKGQVLTAFKQDKTWYNKDNNTFYKKTDQSEINCLSKMQELVKGKYIYLNNKKYYINVPKVYSFQDGVLNMEYCQGSNLEFILRDPKTHDYGVYIFNELFEFILDNKIYWNAFAPRNILIGEDTITFVDFEKGIENDNTSVRDFLRINVYEEYGVFLFPYERLYSISDIFSFRNEENIELKIEDIRYKRYRALLQRMGYVDTVSKEKYLYLLSELVRLEVPQKNEYGYHFVALDYLDIYKNEGINIYCDEVLKRIRK